MTLFREGHALHSVMSIRVRRNYCRSFCSAVLSAGGDVAGLSPKYFAYMCNKSAPFAQKVLKPTTMTLSSGHVVYEPYMTGSSKPEVIHGGVIAAAVDHVGGMCAISALPHKGKIVSTVNLRVDYLSPLPVVAGSMLLEGSTVHYDKTLQLIRTDVICWNADKTTKIAIGRCLFNAYDHSSSNRKYVGLLDACFRLPMSALGPLLMTSIREVQMFRKEWMYKCGKLFRGDSGAAAWSNPSAFGKSEDTHRYRGHSAEDFCEMVENRNPFGREVLRHRVLAVSPGRLSLVLPYRYRFTGNFATPCLHGGVTAALIDQCGGWCAATIMDNPVEHVSTVNLRLDYLAPAPCFEDTLCEAEVVHRSGDLILVSAVCWNHTRTKKLVLGKVWFNVYRPKNISALPKV